MKDKEIFKTLLKQNKYIFAIKDKDSNLEINTSYVFKDTQDCFTLYLVEDINGNVYLTDAAWILDSANNLDIPVEYIINQSKKYNIDLDERQFVTKADILNILEVVESFINFAADIEIIE